jgi:hypothetical protein
MPVQYHQRKIREPRANSGGRGSIKKFFPTSPKKRWSKNGQTPVKLVLKKIFSREIPVKTRIKNIFSANISKMKVDLKHIFSYHYLYKTFQLFFLITPFVASLLQFLGGPSNGGPGKIAPFASTPSLKGPDNRNTNNRIFAEGFCTRLHI